MFYASSGVGGPNHLAGEIFKQMTGAQHRARALSGHRRARIPAVISNQVGAMWGFMAGLIPHIRNGSLKALAVGGKERSAALPDVPTVAEAGVPGYEAVVVDRAAGAGDDAARRRRQAARRGTRCDAANATVTDMLVRGGSEIVASTPEEFRQVIESDYAKYGKLGRPLQGGEVSDRR